MAANLGHASFIVEINLHEYSELLVIHLTIKSYAIVNKSGVEAVHLACLSCHFDMGLFHAMRQEVPQLALSIMLLCLQ